MKLDIAGDFCPPHLSAPFSQNTLSLEQRASTQAYLLYLKERGKVSMGHCLSHHRDDAATIKRDFPHVVIKINASNIFN